MVEEDSTHERRTKDLQSKERCRSSHSSPLERPERETATRETNARRRQDSVRLSWLESSSALPTRAEECPSHTEVVGESLSFSAAPQRIRCEERSGSCDSEARQELVGRAARETRKRSRHHDSGQLEDGAPANRFPEEEGFRLAHSEMVAVSPRNEEGPMQLLVPAGVHPRDAGSESRFAGQETFCPLEEPA